MTAREAFEVAFAQCPLIAILRGVQPNEVEDIGEALFDAGFRLFEVPLNSPDPLDSVGRLARRFNGRAVTGAGTVLTLDDVDAVHRCGGQLVISPNIAPDVVRAAMKNGQVAVPGIATPTEALTALEAGATALKLFPAEGATPAVLKSIRAILPARTRVLPVGGIDVDDMESWLAAGAAGFGIGGAIYAPGRSAAEVGARARRFADRWADLTRSRPAP